MTDLGPPSLHFFLSVRETSLPRTWTYPLYPLLVVFAFSFLKTTKIHDSSFVLIYYTNLQRPTPSSLHFRLLVPLRETPLLWTRLWFTPLSVHFSTLFYKVWDRVFIQTGCVLGVYSGPTDIKLSTTLSPPLSRSLLPVTPRNVRSVLPPI